MYNNRYAYAEVLDVLSNMDNKYVKKIPSKLLESLKENSSGEYKKHIDPNVELSEQNLLSKTLDILAVINLKYWVEDENHKKELIEQYRNNEILNREKNMQKYEYAFEKRRKKKQKQETNLPTVVENGLFKRLFSNILKLFKKKV